MSTTEVDQSLKATEGKQASTEQKAAPAAAKPEKLTAKTFTLNVLNGVALGTVICLMPNALLSELFKSLLPVFPAGQYVLGAAAVSQSMLAAVVGVIVAMMFKFTPIQIGSVALASVMGAGVVTMGEGAAFTMRGTGDIINVGITCAFAVAIVLLLGNKLKAYAILVFPPVVLLLGGGLGLITLPYVREITTGIGSFVAHLTTLQPVPMGILIAMVFSILIVTPVSTVAIALAISLTGVGSAAGNVGVCAAGFGLAICGWKVNSLGTSFAQFIGSPKIQMANVLQRPLTMLPIICNAAVLGVIAVIFNLQGTPQSAGFGVSGLIGPVNALNLAEGGWSFVNIIIALFAFIVAPIILGIFFKWLFLDKLRMLKAEHYLIVFK